MPTQPPSIQHTAATERLWVAAYDVRQPRVRRRVASLLEGHGVRVQRSVFEVQATPAQAAQLRRRCLALLKPGDRFLLEAATRAQLPGLGSPGPALLGYWMA
jgi:CRISPR/Cas system-associated endoribonuclease Cas2